MIVKTKDFQIPKQLEVDDTSSTQTYGKFTAEPFERGFGTTIGNSIRRVLLSSIVGAAVTSIKIEGVLHEFSTIPGVKEDVTDRYHTEYKESETEDVHRQAKDNLSSKEGGWSCAGQGHHS